MSAKISDSHLIEHVRGARGFAWIERRFASFDGWLKRFLPDSLNPLLQTGRVANLSLLIAVVTGVWLLIWYSPSVEYAHSSLQAIEGRGLGGWVRALHRYSSDLVMLVLLIHSVRMFVARKFIGSRWLAWVSGVVLLVLVWFIGWTGYWLVWDQPAQQVALTSMQFMDLLPIFGEPLSRDFLADRLVPSLLFFVVFFTHMLLPLMIAVGLVFHLSRLNRVQLLPNRTLSVALILALAVASFIVPAPLDPAAEMAVKPEQLTVDAWYLTPLALALRFHSLGLWIAVILIPLFVMSFPWLLRRRRSQVVDAAEPEAEGNQAAPNVYQTIVTESRCHACTQCYQDCPYDAIQMLPRTDGKAFNVRAWVDPARCVGCAVCVGSCDSEAMRLPGFDIESEEQPMLDRAQKQLAAGEPVWLAFVSADSEGGIPYFKRAVWENRLPGYQVEIIPTASWLRTKWLERLFKAGVSGVLIVQDGREDLAQARDGNRWIADRLAGQRDPVYRPARAGGQANFKCVDYVPGREDAVREIARSFREQSPSEAAEPSGRPLRKWIVALATCALLMIATVGPSHLTVSNPVDPAPELVFSFRAFGALLNEEEEQAFDPNRPVHMQGRSTAKPERQPVTVRVTVDGVTQEHSYRARGISRDGPAIDELRRPLSVGERNVEIELIKGPESRQQWSGVIEAEPRRFHVISYEPATGFRVE
ncbi:MAG: cytochrome b N-terminal domain-containing protein [Opitutales bacterium]|nr:cytochrome b N-terminal domain-containing protein [Opitutales bacterium]